MALFDQLPVYKECYSLLYMFFKELNNVPRDIKFTLVQSLRNDLVSMMVCVYKANSNINRIDNVQLAREILAGVIIKVRLLHDLQHISTKFYAQASNRMESISKQLTAWQKYMIQSAEPDRNC